MLIGPLLSFQSKLVTMYVLRRQLACNALSSDPPRERRYPSLDRGLLEFIYAVPREQLVRPGQRRSLMRRALIGIVPEELLNRKRKAYVARSPMTTISTEFSQPTTSGSLGIVEPRVVYDILQELREGRAVPLVPLLRTFAIEAWLTNLVHWKCLNNPKIDSRGTEQQALKREPLLASTRLPLS